MFKRLLTSFVPLIAACGIGEEGARGALHVDDLTQLHYVEEMRVGSVDDPEIGFSRISAVVADPGGDVYVLESQAREVRVYGPDGGLLGTRGRSGPGPGEFTHPVAIGLLGDTLWVRDAATQRISWFDSDGTLVHETQGNPISVTTDVPGLAVTVTIGDPLPNGFVGSSYTLGMANGAADRPYYVPTVRFDRDGAVVDTMRWDTIDPGPVFHIGRRALPAPRLQPQSPVTKRQGDEQIEIQWFDGGGVLNVVRLSATGDTVAERTIHYDPIPTPVHARDSLLSRPDGIGSMFGVSDGVFDAARASALELSAHLPPVRSVHDASDGSLWIELEGTSIESTEWLVLEPNLVPRGRAVFPARMKPQYINESAVLMVELDEFEVPWVIRMQAVR